MDRTQAAEAFAAALLEHGYRGGIEVAEGLLANPHRHSALWTSASEWFATLDAEK